MKLKEIIRINVRATCLTIAHRCLQRWFKLGHNRSAYIFIAYHWPDDTTIPNDFNWIEGEDRQVDCMVEDLIFDPYSPIHENLSRVYVEHYTDMQ